MRIGVLGAARIAPTALMKPARIVEGVEVGAVAARDRRRAEAFAAKHGVPVVYDSYAELVADPSLDAVYVPLPNGLHGRWTLTALRAGKHVLCEKPFTANAAEAREVAAAAEGTGLVVMEAFHYRYHPLAHRMLEVVHSGELGTVRRVETSMCFPLPRFSDIRYDFGLAGGALMDAGCYAVHCLRLLSGGISGGLAGDLSGGLAGGGPVVTSATASTLRKDRRIDRAMTARFALPDGATGQIRASMWSRTLLSIRARVVGEHGTMTVDNYAAPQLPSRFVVTVDGKRRRERFGGDSTYTHQLRAFAAAVRGEPTNLTPPQDSIATMSVIDAIYTAAGLPLREQPHA
ncbi:Gfo/Idh/MocA family protein [Paractinoplanes globisporus]|uniref:Gfo/Idh/MocA family protein n=1 Tax=Paractinoplanes globisporus TaxID=113565 RepID=A0ABW6WAH1_9ACTN|nr:Gfo/Idh/MocA family oxidoreductase [Actinoplanes globisporus]